MGAEAAQPEAVEFTLGHENETGQFVPCRDISRLWLAPAATFEPVTA